MKSPSIGLVALYAAMVASCSLRFSCDLYAKGWTEPEGKFAFIPSFYYYNATHQFSTAGTLTDLPYSGSFTAAVLTFYGEWGATKDMTVIGEIPIAHFEYHASDSTHSFTDALTTPFVYVGIGGRYALWRDGNTVVSVSDMFHIPPGFHRGLYDDPNYPFLSDGYVENVSVAEFGTSFAWGWLEGEVAYHARDEDPPNQCEIQFTAGFASRKNITAKLTAGAIKTLAPLPATPVDPQRTIARENYVWLETQVTIGWRGFSVGAGFVVRVVAQHTLDLNGGGLTFIF